MAVEVRVPIIFHAALEIDTDDVEFAKREMIDTIKFNENCVLEMCDRDFAIDEDNIEVKQC